jgi:3D (Asp-Asp-Asp) domain-containing protein
MANGHRTHVGAVAGNRWPLGTHLRVSDSPFGPGVFVVEDRIGWGSELDFSMPGDCAGANRWGRRRVSVAVVAA